MMALARWVNMGELDMYSICLGDRRESFSMDLKLRKWQSDADSPLKNLIGFSAKFRFEASRTPNRVFLLIEQLFAVVAQENFRFQSRFSGYRHLHVDSGDRLHNGRFGL
jgi:hypothetical protein